MIESLRDGAGDVFFGDILAEAHDALLVAVDDQTEERTSARLLEFLAAVTNPPAGQESAAP